LEQHQEQEELHLTEKGPSKGSKTHGGTEERQEEDEEEEEREREQEQEQGEREEDGDMGGISELLVQRRTAERRGMGLLSWQEPSSAGQGSQQCRLRGKAPRQQGQMCRQRHRVQREWKQAHWQQGQMYRQRHRVQREWEQAHWQEGQAGDEAGTLFLTPGTLGRKARHKGSWTRHTGRKARHTGGCCIQHLAPSQTWTARRLH